MDTYREILTYSTDTEQNSTTNQSSNSSNGRSTGSKQHSTSDRSATDSNEFDDQPDVVHHSTREPKQSCSNQVASVSGTNHPASICNQLDQMDVSLLRETVDKYTREFEPIRK